jgi:hypothetical protein
MKMDIRRRCVSQAGLATLGGVCFTALVMGCSALDRGVIGDVLDGHGNGHPAGHGGHGGPPPESGPPATSCGGLLTSDEVLQEIAFDLASADAADRPFLRYVSLANEANARGCGDVLNVQRAALNKLVNSLSLSTTLSAPLPVDVNLTLYRLDLRDYDWDRTISVGNVDFSDGWEALIASSPYAVEFAGDDADDAKADAQTTVPVLFADAFVAAASTAPLYYGLLGIPDNLDDFLLDDLGIDVAADRADHELVRAGLEGTGFAAAEFLAERFDIEVRAGYVWQIFSDFDGAAALIDDPLGTPPAEERELAFTLPNGLLGHALADANGTRIDASDLLLDTNEVDFRAKVARSYFRLRPQGVAVTDALRQLVLDNPGDYSPEEVAAVLDIYPDAGELNAVLASDRAIFAASLADVGVDIDAQPEPIGQTFASFDADVTLATAAADLYLTPEELRENLSVLDPALGVLDGGAVDRDDFTTLYVNSLCVLGVINENQVSPELCD